MKKYVKKMRKDIKKNIDVYFSNTEFSWDDFSDDMIDMSIRLLEMKRSTHVATALASSFYIHNKEVTMKETSNLFDCGIQTVRNSVKVLVEEYGLEDYEYKSFFPSRSMLVNQLADLLGWESGKGFFHEDGRVNKKGLKDLIKVVSGRRLLGIQLRNLSCKCSSCYICDRHLNGFVEELEDE